MKKITTKHMKNLNKRRLKKLLNSIKKFPENEKEAIISMLITQLSASLTKFIKVVREAPDELKNKVISILNSCPSCSKLID